MRRAPRNLGLLALGLGLVACGADAVASPDAGLPDAGQPDAGLLDSGLADGALPCEDEGRVERRACGDCGSVTLRCEGGLWSISECEGEGECTPGQAGPVGEACGRCGMRFPVCEATCSYGPTFTECVGEGACVPGAVGGVDVGACTFGTARPRRCGASCGFAAALACEPAPPVDLMVLVDVTRDMRGSLDPLATPLEELVSDLQLRYPDLMVGLSTYRDVPAPPGSSIGGFGVDSPFMGVLPPTADGVAFREAFEGLDPRGGGDDLESAVEALAHLADKAPLPSAEPFDCAEDREGGGCWRPGSWRLVLLITNAASHEGPSYEGSTASDLEGVVATWEDTAAELRVRGMRLVVLAPGRLTGERSSYERMSEDLGGSAEDVVPIRIDPPLDLTPVSSRFRAALGL